MSSGVKKALRSAREALTQKEYREALQHCKAALSEDKKCYEAYL
jgi:superkiller protein 3